MTRHRIVCVLIAVAMLASCGEPLTVQTNNGSKVYPTYGFFNESSDRSKNVCYRVSVGNVIWSIVLIETVIAPVYFLGFSLFNPVRMKRDANDNCDSSVD